MGVLSLNLVKEGLVILQKSFGLFLCLLILIFSGCSLPEKKEISPKKIVKPTVTKITFPKIDHIVVVVEENHSVQVIANNHSAPYINSLMRRGANFTNYYAIEHPSQPNYLDLFSGSNQGVTNDHMPSTKFSSINLASELRKIGYTFCGYSEGLPREGFNGPSTGSGGYARKHNPWVNFTNVAKNENQPLKNFSKNFSQLPTVSFVIPTLQHDMHDGTIKEGDLWLKKTIDPFVKWALKHNSLLIVTWDEDDYSQNNKVPAFFVGPMIKGGSYKQKINHFNLLRTIEDIYGLSYAGKSNEVNPIADIWK